MAVTHSFFRELSPHDRGKTEEIMRALAERDGYFGVLIVPFFITPEPQARLEHFVAHVDRVVEIMGIDRVGIGTDWGARVEGFQSWREWPNITRALIWSGYSDAEITKLLGANFLRIFHDVVG